MEHYIISKLSKDSTASKLVTKKWVKENIYHIVSILIAKI